MYTILRNLIIVLINLCLFLATAEGQARRDLTSLRCFDERHPPPTIAGGMSVEVMASPAGAANRHPEKKAWPENLTHEDFEKRNKLPNEIVQDNPGVTIWTTSFWEGWWEVGCAVEPSDEKKVVLTVHYNGFESATWFWRERSGRIVDEINQGLFPHEQGHFDIVELGRRRWQNRAEEADQALIELAAQGQFNLRLVDFSSPDQTSISKKARELIERLASQLGLKNILHRFARFKLIDAGWAEGVTEVYELQTKYGADSQEQERWNNEIDNMFDGKRMSDSKPE